MPIPGSVVEILAGIVVGPPVLGLVDADQVIDVLATLGVAFLLFLAGLELDFDRCAAARSSSVAPRSVSPSSSG